MSAPIDLRIQGETSEVEALANSIDDFLVPALLRQQHVLDTNRINFSSAWKGEAADAFSDCCEKLSSEISEDVTSFVRKVSEVVRAYAWRLNRGKELFASYADTAAQAGLVIRDNFILPPTLRGADDDSGLCLITDVDPAVMRIPSPIELFAEITSKVGTWHGEHEVWITEHFTPLAASGSDAVEFSGLLGFFQENESAIYDSAMAGADDAVGGRANDIREAFKVRSAEYDDFSSARHALNYEMFDSEKAVSGTAFKDAVDRLQKVLDRWNGLEGGLRNASAIIEVSGAANDLMLGDEFGEIASKSGGSALGAAAAARLASKGEFGLIASFLLVGGGALVGTKAGESLWEMSGDSDGAHIPLGVREEILSWLDNPGELETGRPRE